MVLYETPDLIDLNESAVGYGGGKTCVGGSSPVWGCQTGNRAATGCHTGNSDGSWCGTGNSGMANPGT